MDGSDAFKGVVECFDLGEMQGSNRDGVLTSVLQPSNTHKRDVFGVSAGKLFLKGFAILR